MQAVPYRGDGPVAQDLVAGQVQRPGEYQVPDGINVMELIARAGGPTEFAELSAVRLTRAGSTPDAAAPPSPRVLYVNLDEYMYSKKPIDVPTLQPGDIVLALNNIAIEDSADLPPIIGASQPGTELVLTVLRDGQSAQLKVKVGELGQEGTIL